MLAEALDVDFDDAGTTAGADASRGVGAVSAAADAGRGHAAVQRQRARRNPWPSSCRWPVVVRLPCSVGAAAVKATLADAGFDVAGVTMDDSSGLSYDNRVSATILDTVMSAASAPESGSGGDSG